MVDKVTQFLKEVRQELSKVSWPGRDQIIQSTIIVIAISLAMAVFLGLLDFIFEWLLNTLVLR